jgi:acetolactate synthase-1/2/3 large subunit
MRVCDWIAEKLYSVGVDRIHGLMGGGASGLNDGFIKHPQLDYICYHHEQGAGHAAIGESKFTGKLSVVNPTTGCGGTNCVTSVLSAWQDSVPVLFVSGNVKLSTCSGWINKQKELNIRRYGVQEHHIVDTVRSMTKASYFITSVHEIGPVLTEAIQLATSGRPGPVWIDVPADIQTAPMLDFTALVQPTASNKPTELFLSLVKEKLAISERPVVLAGYGIRQAGAINAFIKFIEKYNTPYVSTYGARDYLPHTHRLNIGTVGVRGSRAGNFALQNADLLIVLGSSLNSSVIGYDPEQFSPYSYKMIVDIDYDELRKDIIPFDNRYYVDLKDFFDVMINGEEK